MEESDIYQWNALISESNWKKGQILSRAIVGKPTDGKCNKIASLLGGITGHHVNRLVVTWRKFGRTRHNWKHLFWAHFFAAIEWDDAVYWLREANCRNWPVKEMKIRRWEAQSRITLS